MWSISRRLFRYCRNFSQKVSIGKKEYRQSLLNSTFTLAERKEDEFLNTPTEALEKFAADELIEYPASLRASINQFVTSGSPNDEFKKFVEELAVHGKLEHICQMFDAHEVNAKAETLSWCLTMRAKLFFDYGKVGAAKAVIAQLKEKKLPLDPSISFKKSII